MIIDKIEKAKNLVELIETIKEFYKKYDDMEYIPAIYSEGAFSLQETVEPMSSKEFYAKLIIRPYNSKINKTWVLSNLSNNFFDGSDNCEKIFSYNLIVHRNMFQNNIYTLNPTIYSSNYYITEEDYNNNSLVNLKYIK